MGYGGYATWHADVDVFCGEGTHTPTPARWIVASAPPRAPVPTQFLLRVLTGRDFVTRNQAVCLEKHGVWLDFVTERSLMKRYTLFAAVLIALLLAGWSWGGGGALTLAGQFWGSLPTSDVGPIWP